MAMAKPKAPVFSRLLLPRPLDPRAVERFLVRLAAERASPRVVLELRADEHGLRHLLGCHASDVQLVRRTLGDFIADTLLTTPTTDGTSPRPAVEIAGRLRIRPSGLPLRADTALTTTTALFSAFALAASRRSEAIVLQVILGPGRTPRMLPANVSEPGTSFLRELLSGARPASADTRARLKECAAQAGFAVTIRLGAASPDHDRRRRFVRSLLSALSTTESPGVRLDLLREHPKHLIAARLPWRWPLRLSVPELTAMIGWPLGDHHLPGLPPAHPRALRPAANVHTGPRVFAASAVPGDDRLIGIASKDQCFHAVAYGVTGTGKSNTLLHLILADIQAGRPVAVLDPKRQLVDDILARMPEDRMSDVVEVNAAETAPCGFNPLDVSGRDPDVVVDGILAVFEAIFHDGWGPRSSDIVSGSLRTLARTSTPERPATLVDLPRILTDPRFRRQQVGRVQGDTALAGFWSWYDSQSPQAQAAAIAAPMNKLRQFLLRPALIKMLEQRHTPFRLRNIFRENKIVLVPLNEGLIGPGTASLLGSLIIADLWQAAQERASEPAAETRPGMIYVDEAPRFLHLPISLADALAISRSLSVGWFLAAQFRNQFPPALRIAVDMNARSKIQFATEYDDARDAAKLAPALTARDFVALPQFHAYSNLVADGLPSGWALIKTLPPPAAIRDPEAVRAAVRAAYTSEPPTTEAVAPNGSDTNDQEQQQATATPDRPDDPAPIERIGRKRRKGGQQ